MKHTILYFYFLFLVSSCVTPKIHNALLDENEINKKNLKNKEKEVFSLEAKLEEASQQLISLKTRIEELLQDHFVPKLNQIKEISEQLNVTMAQLSIAWCLKNKNVSSVILGASKKAQLKENLESLKVYESLTDEVTQILDR